METDKQQFGEKGTLMYADAAVNPDPTAEQLADIAIATGRSARSLLGWEPRIAMLSFSTKGSANHPLVDKVIRATEIAKTKAPEMDVDGELQADSAIVPEVAKKKIREPGLVAGRANILVFPDLNAGNIAYKLTQYLGGAKAYGPILQGFSKPISDLSRGAKIEDVVGVIAIVCVLSQSEK
jgi:phosphate acetyltransferase